MNIETLSNMVLNGHFQPEYKSLGMILEESDINRDCPIGDFSYSELEELAEQLLAVKKENAAKAAKFKKAVGDVFLEATGSPIPVSLLNKIEPDQSGIEILQACISLVKLSQEQVNHLPCPTIPAVSTQKVNESWAKAAPYAVPKHNEVDPRTRDNYPEI